MKRIDNQIQKQIEIDKSAVISMHLLWIFFFIIGFWMRFYFVFSGFFLALAIYFNIDMGYWQLRKETK